MSAAEEERWSAVVDDLCAAAAAAAAVGPQRGLRKRVTARGLALLLLGASVAMMACGWLTFLLGFLLMPWVLATIFFLHVLAMLSTLAVLARSLFSAFHPSKDPSGSGVSWDVLDSS